MLMERHTGLSDQLSPNSFMFAFLSSMIGLMCGIALPIVCFALLTRAPMTLFQKYEKP